MTGRIKRRQALAAQSVRAETQAASPVCALCRRPLGARVEWHHRIPKSKGGEETVPVHPICHLAIHAAVPNRQLASDFADLDALRAREDISRFLRWIANKPADFYAPTRGARAS